MIAVLAGAALALSSALAPVFPRAFFEPNPFQSRVIEARRAGAREIWALAGNNAGKSRLGARCAVAEAMLGGADEVVWVGCRDGDVQREVTQPPVLAYLAPHEIARRPYSFRGKIDRILTRRAAGLGRVIQFRNYAEGAGSVRGPGSPFAWLDELTGGRAVDYDYYQEVRRGVAKRNGWILSTLTAVDGMTPLLKNVLDRFTAGEDGLAVVYGDTSENMANLDADAITAWQKGLDEWEIEVRTHGRVLPLRGKPYVPAATLQAFQVAAPIRTYERDGLKVVVFEEPAPAASYTVGLDAAEGVGRDLGAGVVEAVGWEAPCRVAAVCYGDVRPRTLGAVGADLALEYRGRDRTALVNPEANGPGLVVIEELLDRRVRVMARPGADDGTPAPERLGYLTGRRSREVLLQEMREDLVGGGLLARAREIRDALGTFVWGRRPEAAPGFTDDLVIALGLAHYAARSMPAPRPERNRPTVARAPETADEHIRGLRRRTFG